MIPDSLVDKRNTKLKVVVLYSAGHLGSAVILNRLLGFSEIEIVGVVKAQPLPFTLSASSKIKKHLRKVGWKFAWLLFWQRCIQAIGFALTFLLPFLRKRIRPAWSLALKHNIPVLHTDNINSAQSLAFLKVCGADLYISAYFSQILKRETLQLPKKGVLNVHPGWLPSYQGAMAYFWVLKNNQDKAGVTIHWIDEGIDTGQMLARKSFKIEKNSTQDQVLIFTAVIGARLLRRVLKRIVQGKSPVIHETDPSESTAYFPMPGSGAFKSYFSNRRFFRIRNILGILIGKFTK